MGNVTIGVIGAGLIGRKHLRTISEQPDYDLVGIADVNVDAVAAEYPKTRVFADYRKLLDEARPQAVIIASPNQLHAENGIECARRGIHILIEKPVTDTIESATALMAEVRKGGIKSLVGHHRRHHLQVRTLKALLGEGRIGDVVGVSAIWATHKPADYFEVAPWRSRVRRRSDPDQFDPRDRFSALHRRRNRGRGGGRVEPPAWICGGGYRRRPDRVRQRRAGTFFVSDSAVSPWTTEQGIGESTEFPFSGQSNYRFMGRRGAIEFPELVQWTQAGDAQDWNQPIQAQRIHAPTIDPYTAQLDHFRDVIRGAVPSLQPVEDGARSLLATLAIAEAAADGRRIDLRERYAAL